MAESALRGLVPRPQEIVAPTRSWNPLNPAFRDTVSSAVSNLLGSSNIAGREGYDRSRYADMLTGSVDFVPGVSEAAGVGDVRREVSQGNYPGAALAGVATALGVVPVIGDAAAKAVRGLDMSQAARMQRADDMGGNKMITISSQRYLDDSVVAQKLADNDFEVLVSPVFEHDGMIMRVVVDGHHSLAAAKLAGVEPKFYTVDSRDVDNVQMIEDGLFSDYLEATWIDSDYYNVDTGVEIW